MAFDGLGMLVKKTMLIYGLLETGGGGGGGKMKNCLLNAENELVFLAFLKKNPAHFWEFEDKGEGGNLKIVLRRQKIAIIFLSSVPKDW